MRKIILGLMCGAFATLSYADNCDKARNTYDDIYCTNKIYASADADLNKNYQQFVTNSMRHNKRFLKSPSSHGFIIEMQNVLMIKKIA